jgi:hypothetical protein
MPLQRQGQNRTPGPVHRDGVQPPPLGAPPVLGGAQESVKGSKRRLRADRNVNRIGRNGDMSEETTAGLILRDGKRKITANRRWSLAVMGNCRQLTFSAQPIG